MPRSRNGTANSRRSARNEIREASAKSTSVSVISARSLTLALEPEVEQPEHRPGEQPGRREEHRARHADQLQPS
jgi:hypothetical protein